MVASPNDLPLLDATLERRRMAEAIDHLVESRTVELKWVEGQTWRDLARPYRKGSGTSFTSSATAASARIGRRADRAGR